jgi:hypothetical protein
MCITPYNEEEVRVFADQAFDIRLPILLHTAESTTKFTRTLYMRKICPRDGKKKDIDYPSDSRLGKRSV